MVHLLLLFGAMSSLSQGMRPPSATRRAGHRRAMKKAAKWCSSLKERCVRSQHHHAKTVCRQRRRHAGVKIRLPLRGRPL